jgi:hypothetical protein
LGGERLHAAICKVNSTGEAFFELDVPTFLFTTLKGLFEDGPIGAHGEA